MKLIAVSTKCWTTFLIHSNSGGDDNGYTDNSINNPRIYNPIKTRPMKKLLFFAALIITLFFFREGLNQYWIKHFDSKADESSWLLSERKSIDRKLSSSDLSFSIRILTTFKDRIQNELNKVNSNSHESSEKYHRNLVCELAVAYKKIAMLHLQNGADEMYMQFIGMSQEKFVECADLKSDVVGN